MSANLQPPRGVSIETEELMWKPGAQKPRPASERDGDAVKGLKAAPTEPRATTKSTLTQKTLAMKFMQRKKNHAEEKRVAVEAQRKSDTWELDEEPSSDRLVCVRDVPDPSVLPIFGRRSFGGFNKAVEDEYREVSRQSKFAASEERELREEVSAQEMASRMIKYTGLLRGPQGNRPNKKQRKG